MQLTIRMPDEYKARLEDVASRTGLKKSDIARLAVTKYIEAFYDRLADQDRPIDRAADLVGVVDSGISDLGSQHRRHLLNRIRGEES